MNYQHIKFAVVASLIQLAFLLIYGFRVKYDDAAHATVSGKDIKNPVGEHDNAINHVYPFFQDVQMMMLIGFAYLMTFLKRYGFSAIGLNFMLVALVIQWSVVMHGVGHLDHVDHYITVGVHQLLASQFTVAAILISYGAVLGKTSPLQLLIMAMIEVPVLIGNEYCGRVTFMALDMGDSIFIHMFGAYFGMACAWVLYYKDTKSATKEESSYTSDIFAMIGTLTLWVYWPSFNSGSAKGDAQHRAVVNTVISLAACTFTCFIMQAFLPPEGKHSSGSKKSKFDMVIVQNSTIAGGVVVGSICDMMIHPWGAMLCGVFVAIVSSLGYYYLTPALRKIGLHDTCGVHNLHGMPGVISGFASCVVCHLATYEIYGATLYDVFPAMLPSQNSTFTYTVQYGGVRSIPPFEGLGRPNYMQGRYQLAAIAVTFVLAVGGGVFAGLIMRIPWLNRPKTDESLFDDHKFWVLPPKENCHVEHRIHVSEGYVNSGMDNQNGVCQLNSLSREGNYIDNL